MWIESGKGEKLEFCKETKILFVKILQFDSSILRRGMLYVS